MNRHPAIWIFKARSVLTDSFQPVLWGLEEEGIPFEIREVSNGPIVDLAKQAAEGSPLNVGIGIGESGEVILHHHDLPTETPLFSLTTKPWQPVRLRHLGINAARLVFRSDGDSLADVDDSLRTPQDESEELINLILDEILKGYDE
jgi:hypothetical protein